MNESIDLPLSIQLYLRFYIYLHGRALGDAHVLCLRNMRWAVVTIEVGSPEP